MMRVVLDTNILLNFYRGSDQSLESVSALLNLVKNKKIDLVFSRQILDEFYRDRPVVLKSYFQNLEKVGSFGSDTPVFLKNYAKIRKLINFQKKISFLGKEIVEECRKKLLNPNSKVNRAIAKLFAKAKIYDVSEELLQRAYYRTRRGNPPRKDNNSFGDAIIWETILSNLTEDNVTVISHDGDFESEIETGKLHEFLEHEWRQKTEKHISLEKNLGAFINSFTKKQIVKKESIDEENRVAKSFQVHASPLSFTTIQPNYLMGNQDGIYNPSTSLKLDNTNLGFTHSDLENTNIICPICGQNYSYLGSHICPSLLHGSGPTFIQ